MVVEHACRYLIHGLGGTAIVLDRLLKGVTAEELDQRPDPDRFTLREVIAHLADWEGVWHERMQRLRDEDLPLLPGYDEGQWAIDHDYTNTDAAERLAHFREGRAALVALLQSLPADAWTRKGRHGEWGDLTLFDLASLVLGHDGYHLRQVV